MPYKTGAGGSYTPTRGLLAGQTFATPFQYQTARSQAMGFRSYNEERNTTKQQYFQALENRFMAVHGVSRTEARTNVQAEVRLWSPDTRNAESPGGATTGAPTTATNTQRYRKGLAVKWALEEGLYDSGDDAADDIAY